MKNNPRNSLIAAPRAFPSGPGSKYRYKLVYPNGYVKYVRHKEDLPLIYRNKMKNTATPTDTMRETASELLKVARTLLLAI